LNRQERQENQIGISRKDAKAQRTSNKNPHPSAFTPGFLSRQARQDRQEKLNKN
jgi:hypothetical protein